MKNKVVSFSSHAKVRNAERRAKVLKGIDRKKIQEYHKEFVEPTIRHMSLLQRFLVDEYLMDILFVFFILGVDASRLCMGGENQEAILERTFQRNLDKIPQVASRMELNQYIDDWDLYGVYLLAESIAEKWVHEGIEYGIKQRKMRLL